MNDAAISSAATASRAAPTARRIGVLLVNLGTPEAPTPAALRRYLREFLSDARVIENNGLIWQIILNGIILVIRPRRRARDYAKIWNHDKNESPLKTISRAQAEKLAATFTTDRRPVIDWAMRYGEPSIAARLAALAAQGCTRVLVVPLYPQYAGATTATVGDEVFRALQTMRAQPALRIAAPYYDDPVYIDALAASLNEHLRSLSFAPEIILASFHGIPKDYADKGDPYPQHCAETTRLLRSRLGVDDTRLLMTYQSRFGRAEWLKPYTDETVAALARRGVKSIAVITPGFSADCLETLEEIAVENAEIFHRNGGENFAVVPCLNDSAGGMAVISALVRRELAGWL